LKSKGFLKDCIKSVKELSEKIKEKKYGILEVTKSLNDIDEIRIEETGYLTFINTEKEEH